mgnify:CR=1 FL=1
MDDGSRLPWIISVLLLLCAMYFAVAETSIASASHSKMKAAAEHGDRLFRGGVAEQEPGQRRVGVVAGGAGVQPLEGFNGRGWRRLQA